MAVKKLVFHILFLFLCIGTSYAQQFNNWVFLNNNGLTFNTNPPSFFGGGQITNNPGWYSCASISNANGQLLFYSDGVRVWNKNNQLMPNGTGLLGDEGAINTALIIPFINDSNKYYLFTANGLALYLPNSQSTLPYSYSIIDMQLNGGLGDVVFKNTLIQYFSTEKMVAIPNANSNDIWWVCRDWTNHFYSYKITCAGFQNSNPVVSTIGNNVNNTFSLIAAGDIKASPDGKFIAVIYESYFELYKFDNTTGLLSSPIFINTNINNSYGVEFSPNSKFVYISGQESVNNNGTLFIRQYELTNYNATSIINSAYTVTNLTGYGCLQLAPNNKIYHNYGGDVVEAINNPNIQGVGCNFQDSAIILPNPAQRRFPYSYVNLITAQNVQISYTVAPDCRTVTFTGKTYIKGNNLTFKWKWGEPPPVGGTIADSATQVVASQGDTTYTTITHVYPPGIDTFFVNLSVTSDTVCGTGRAGVKVIVKPPKPKANFGYTNTCNNLNVVFTDSSLLNFNPSLTYTYAYKLALAPATAYTNFSALPNNNFTFAVYDSFDIRLVVKSNLSCVTNDTIIKRIILKAKPTAGFGYTNTCGSLQANITSAANITAGSIVLQEYFVGNTLIGTGASFTYTFASYGSYVVKHVVKSNAGCLSDTVPVTVIIKAKPTLNLTTARDSVCTNTTYTITANATVNASTISGYVWVKDGVVLPTTTNNLTQNNITGTYVYKVVATSAQGCKNDTATKIITVVSKPIATLNATNVCGSKTINITSGASVINDNITNYYLSYGNGITSITNPNNTTYSYANYGSYDLKFVAKSSIGCANDTVPATVIVKDKPTLNITYNNDACTNKNFTLTATAAVNASTIAIYTWIKDGIILPNTSDNLTQNNVASAYVYKVTATAATGCTSDAAIQNVTVENFNTTIFTAASGCVGKNIVLTNTSINNNPLGAIIYTWSTSDGQTSNAVLPNFSFATSGTKTIQLKTNTANNCADSIAQTIRVEDSPIANFNITEACLGKKITVVNNSINATNYNWSASNGQSSSAVDPDFIFNTVGNYNIKLLVVTPNNCTNEIDKNINIQAVKLFTTPASDTNVVINQPVVLSVNGAASYSWQTAAGSLQNANNPSPIFTASTAGIYPIQIEGTTAQGCKGTTSIKINVFAASNYVWIPNAFTPNNDNLNDRVKITCSGLQQLTNFTIYNRYGQSVYTQNTCNVKGWDGTYKGSAQPMGACIYTWSGVDFKGNIVKGEGTVMLVR
jgi:gliding motility-associated-like protein